jgi:hypothetical protein
MSSKSILVATREIHGGTDKGGLAVLAPREELTAEKRKELGLDKEALASLIESGALLEQTARVAGAGDMIDAATHRAAVERADKAEQDLATANQALTAASEQIASLTTQLEAAKKATPAQ